MTTGSQLPGESQQHLPGESQQLPKSSWSRFSKIHCSSHPASKQMNKSSICIQNQIYLLVLEQICCPLRDFKAASWTLFRKFRKFVAALHFRKFIAECSKPCKQWMDLDLPSIRLSSIEE
jgi:hypothetical protein